MKNSQKSSVIVEIAKENPGDYNGLEFKKEGTTMKKIIRKREYDTETATLIHKHTVGAFGDPAGYEETLFQTADGYYFLYVNGGEASQYPAEDLVVLAKTKVRAWLEERA